MESIVDSNPEFAALNPQLRDGIREARRTWRHGRVLSSAAGTVAPLLAQIVDEIPRKRSYRLATAVRST